MANKHIKQEPAIRIFHAELPAVELSTLFSEEYKAEYKTFIQACAKLEKQAKAAPELLKMLDSLLFIAESVAHLKGLEREVLPTTDAIRAKLEGLK